MSGMNAVIAGFLALTATAAPSPVTRTATGRPGYAAAPVTRTETGRMAYAMVKGKDGGPTLDMAAFLLTRVAFSHSDDPDRWPAVCDRSWNWDELAHRFVPLTTASAYLSGTPNCVFTGTIYFKCWLMPRTEVWPSFTVSVEGAQGIVAVPVTVRLDDRQRADWSGIPVILGAISTTGLADGPQRLRVNGGWRDIGVDGNPATPEFEEGGDGTVTFTVRNR